MSRAPHTGPRKRRSPGAVNSPGRLTLRLTKAYHGPVPRQGCFSNWTREGIRLAKLTAHTRQAIHAKAFLRHVAGMIAMAGRFFL